MKLALIEYQIWDQHNVNHLIEIKIYKNIQFDKKKQKYAEMVYLWSR